MNLHLMKEVCAKLLRSHFPPVNVAFAYGSAVFKQHSRTKVQDKILIVGGRRRGQGRSPLPTRIN